MTAELRVAARDLFRTVAVLVDVKGSVKTRAMSPFDRSGAAPARRVLHKIARDAHALHCFDDTRGLRGR